MGAALAAVILPGTAAGAAGTIALAEADSNWAGATLRGFVNRTIECVSFPESPKFPTGPGFESPAWEPEPRPEPPEYFPRCGWVPYATLGPAPPEGDCSSPDRRWPAVGDGVQLVWSEERTGIGSASFELEDVPLQHGADAPLLCLSAIEAAAEGIICVQVVPSPCPPYAIVGRHYQLDSAMLEPLPPISEPTVEPTTESSQPEAGPIPLPGTPKSQRKRCRRGQSQGESKSQLGQTKLKRKRGCRRSTRAIHKAGTQN